MVFQPTEDEDLRQRTPGKFSLSLDETCIDGAATVSNGFLALVVKWNGNTSFFVEITLCTFLHYTRGVSDLQHFS